MYGRKGCIRFLCRLDKNPDFHGNRKRPLTYNGENDVSSFSLLFFHRSFSKSRTNSNFGQIGLLRTELGALERLKNFPLTYNGKMVSQSLFVHFLIEPSSNLLVTSYAPLRAD